jgi:hypothetical protein
MSCQIDFASIRDRAVVDATWPTFMKHDSCSQPPATADYDGGASLISRNSICVVGT